MGNASARSGASHALFTLDRQCLKLPETALNCLNVAQSVYEKLDSSDSRGDFPPAASLVQSWRGICVLLCVFLSAHRQRSGMSPGNTMYHISASCTGHDGILQPSDLIHGWTGSQQQRRSIITVIAIVTVVNY